MFYLLMKSSNSRANGSEEDLQGLSFKAWSMSKSRFLIPSFTRKLTINLPLGGAFEHSVWTRGEGIKGSQSSKVQMPGWLPGGTLKLRIFRNERSYVLPPFQVPSYCS